MIDDNSVAYDLESLKIAARASRLEDTESRIPNQRNNRNDIVHAGYRVLQCVAAGIIFVFHITANVTLGFPSGWNLTYVTIYPTCFIASLILAITRMMNVIPNPTPIVPVTISLIGWSVMLTGGLLAMRHSAMHLHVDEMTDDEIAASPIYRHDLIMCSLSLVGSSLYLVHAWLCYDCWSWEKREKNLRAARDSGEASTAEAESTPEDETSSGEREAKQRSDSSVTELPSTSVRCSKSPENGCRKFTRASKLLEKLRRTSKVKQEEVDPFVSLNEILRHSVRVQQTVSHGSMINIH